MAFVRAGLSKAVILSALIGVAGCATGEDDWVVRAAREYCAAEGLSAADTAYDGCVAKRADARYEYWLRVMKTEGD
jgi:hypothetical protein